MTVGLIMVVSGGLLAAFQRHLGRIMGYAVIVETGFSILTISLGGSIRIGYFLHALGSPRPLVWSYGHSP